MTDACLIVPCYNEASRLRLDEFAELTSSLRLLFVDDGSTDETSTVLSAWCSRQNGRADVLRLTRNVGKGEAVRAGLQAALAKGADIVGYADADLATPVSELLRLYEILKTQSGTEVVLGCRFQHLGVDISRKAIRHYLGRIFATLVSIGLKLSVYDTQCGAKFFRTTEILRAAIARPFVSRWLFDVELLKRLIVAYRHHSPTLGRRVLEVPLEQWTDVPGSKLSLLAYIRASADLFRIFRQ